MTLKWSIDQALGRLAFGKLIPMAGGTYSISVSGQTAGTTYVFYVMDETAENCLARSTCTDGAYSIAFNQTELRKNFEKHWHEIRTFHTVVSDGTNTIAEGDLPIQWNPVWTEPTTGAAYSMRGPQGIQGLQGNPGADGADGEDGEDGHSPVITASRNGRTTSIKVDGAEIATVNDGEDGATGPQGEIGPKGETGATGATGATGPQGAAGTPASVVQVLAPDETGTNKWHYMYARLVNGKYVLALDQSASARDASYIVPQGGSAGQVLTKNSAADYDAGWSNAGTGDVTGAIMNGLSVTKADGLLQLGTVLTSHAAHSSNDVQNLDTTTCAGLKVVTEEPSTYEANVIYFIKASS